MNPLSTILDKKRMEQVILFFLERINNVHLGRTKLMKLLYYVDFDHYQKRGHPITNAKYRKLPQGPVPDKAEKVIESMVKAELVKSVITPCGSFNQRRLITSKGQFDSSLFTGDELETLEQVASRWRDATAVEIASATHKEAPWAATDDGKMIDYELAEYRSAIGEEGTDKMVCSSSAFAKVVPELA